MGIKVILDVVHSHSCSNDIESLNKYVSCFRPPFYTSRLCQLSPIRVSFQV
jgi:1,4-alpha-glucan branching enzyme